MQNRLTSAMRRTGAALAVAVATAVLLTVAWAVTPTLWSDWFGPRPPHGVVRSHLIPMEMVVFVAAMTALVWAVLSALLAVPIWLWLIRRRRHGLWSAVALGVILAELSALASNLPLWTLVSPSYALGVGLIGASSGAAAWRVFKGEVS